LLELLIALLFITNFYLNVRVEESSINFYFKMTDFFRPFFLERGGHMKVNLFMLSLLYNDNNLIKANLFEASKKNMLINYERKQ